MRPGDGSGVMFQPGWPCLLSLFLNRNWSKLLSDEWWELIWRGTCSKPHSIARETMLQFLFEGSSNPRTRGLMAAAPGSAKGNQWGCVRDRGPVVCLFTTKRYCGTKPTGSTAPWRVHAPLGDSRRPPPHVRQHRRKQVRALPRTGHGVGGFM